jgi:ABC-type Fe3+ transport system substrate-binding protein
MSTLTSASAILSEMTPANRLFAQESGASSRTWDFLGSVPVPLRQRIHDGVVDAAAGQLADGGAPLRCCFPAGHSGIGLIQRLRYVRSLEEFPNMLVSAEHGNLFNRRFHEKYVAAGAFSACQPEDVAEAFSECGLIDPQGSIGVFAVAPFVFLIDLEKLGGRPIPRRWADLLDPIYRGQVIFSGWRRPGERYYSQYNKFLLLSIAQEFGLGGVAKLLRNAPALMHSAQMPRVAGSGSSPGGIYVLPWLMADMCPRRRQTEIVWPEDGALAYPLWLTVKAEKRQALDALVRYFHGAELGAYLNANRYPALAPGNGAGLPEEAKLKWPGWDYVRHRSTAGVVKAAGALFREAQDRWPVAEEIRRCA